MSLSAALSPFVSVLSKKYGNRSVVVIGSILAFIGLSLSVFSTNVIYLTITYGVLTGIANCATRLPTLDLLGRYFRLKHPIAQGIGVTGFGLGIFLMPPLSHYLNRNYGWRGTFFIVSGLSLHTLVVACLLRPIYLKSDEELQQLHVTRRASQQLKEVRRASQQLYEMRRASQGMIEVRRASQQSKEVRKASQQLNEIRGTSKSGNLDSLTPEELIALNRRRRSSLKIAAEYVKSTAYYSFDIHLFKNRLYLLTILAFVFYGIGTNILPVFIYVHAINLGIDDSRALFLLSAQGIACILSAVIQGFVLHYCFAKLNRVYVYLAGLLIQATFTIALGFAKNYVTLMIYTAICGYCKGMFGSLNVVVIKQVVGEKYFTTGVGMSIPFMGIGQLLGPPISGYLYDATGNYTLSFCFAGSSILLSFLILTPGHVHFRKIKKNTDSENQIPQNLGTRKLSTVRFEDDLNKNNKLNSSNGHASN